MVRAPRLSNADNLELLRKTTYISVHADGVPLHHSHRRLLPSASVSLYPQITHQTLAIGYSQIRTASFRCDLVLCGSI